ncbi:MAG: IS110 family transposase [Candidatus Acidifodinimicrobium sp.]
MLSIGIDTHERMHYVEIMNEKQKIMWHGKVMNNREGFSLLIEKIETIRRSNSDEVVGIFMNPTGNYHIPLKYFLERNGFGNLVFIIDARRTAHQRILSNLGKEKSDPEDAHILASTPWNDPGYRDKRNHERSDLSELTREREIIRRSITRILNDLHSQLAIIFPEFPDIITVESNTGIAILERYTTPDTIAHLSPEELFKLMKEKGKNHFSIDDAVKLINVSRESIGVPDSSGIHTARIRIAVERIRNEISSLKNVEKEIKRMSSGNEDIDRLTEMKGLGVVNVATIVSEIGDIWQFESALKLQSYGGKCPDMTGSSGSSHSTGITKIRNSHLSNAVHESAVSLVLHRNREFFDLFTREISKKKSPTEAYIVVGKRLLYHVYSIMKNKRPYRERLSRKEREGGVSTRV